MASAQGAPLGIGTDPGCAQGSRRMTAGEGALLYTDGLTEARHEGHFLGLDAVTATLAGRRSPSPAEAVAVLRAQATDFAYGALTDDLCLLAARVA